VPDGPIHHDPADTLRPFDANGVGAVCCHAHHCDGAEQKRDAADVGARRQSRRSASRARA
jgi:hypothetical protein